MTLTNVAWIGVIGLLGVGLYGLLIGRNLLRLVIVLQLLVKAAALALVVAGQMSGQLALGQSLAVTAIVADTVVAAVALALVVQVKKRFGTTDIKALAHLKG